MTAGFSFCYILRETPVVVVVMQGGVPESRFPFGAFSLPADLFPSGDGTLALSLFPVVDFLQISFLSSSMPSMPSNSGCDGSNK
ncbi:hypothetical protein L1887_09177 [Cichorium endivia]|nr:hypothetical protein L1887_09177 [Cichorium endivia]